MIRRLKPWMDPLVAVALCVAVEAELLTADYREGPIAANALVLAAMSLPLAWRRRAPLVVGFVVLGATIAETVWLTNISLGTSTIYVAFVPPYTFGAWLDLRRAVPGLLAYVGLGTAISIFGHDHLSDIIFISIVICTSWAAGRAMRTRRLLESELEAEAARIEAERESRERLAVADERTRIARELHAVVANSVTAMVVEAQTAERLLDDDPEAADAATAEIERTGRQALSEMRRILGVLRAEEEGPELAPAPGIGQLPALAEQARAAGLDIELRVEGEPGPLPPGADLTAYRILQGAMRNFAEHARDGHGFIVVRYRESDVELLLYDDGPSTGRLDGNQEAIAIRERVEMWGGEVASGPRPEGGFQLRVVLPRAYEEVFA